MTLAEIEPRVLINRDWLTILCFVWLGLLAYVRLIYPARLKQFRGTLFSEQYVNLYAREERWLFNNFNVPMGILFFMALSLITVQLNQAFNWFDASGFPTFAILFGLFLGLYVFRTLLILFFGRVFRIESTIRYALLRRYTNAVLIGQLWFATCVLVLFLPFGNLYVLFIGLTAGFLLLLWGYFQILRKLLKKTRLYFYYIILYICALEIAPILLIAKWMADSI